MPRHLAVFVVLLISSSQASAQTPAPGAPQTPAVSTWEIEVHGGFAGAGSIAGATGTAFPVGTTFTTVNGSSTRAASSWFFGDGATLLNQLGAGFSTFPTSTRILSLNPALTSASLDRDAGGSFGVRLSRRLKPRLRAELLVDSHGGSLAFTSTARSQIEATRASFIPMWNAIVATGGGVVFTNPTVTATANFVDNVNRRQTLVAGVGTFDLGRRGRFVPYVSGGAGVQINSGDTPSATLTGHYAFTINLSQPSGASVPLDETDVATVHFAQKDHAAVGVFGAGFRYHIRPRQGLRVDLRFEVGGDPIDTLVDGTPARVLGTPAGWIPSTTTPAIQLSNAPASARGNLSDPPISDLRTFVGQGAQTRMNLSIGWFFRF